MNSNNNYSPRTFEEEYASVKGMNAFITKVFGWMFIGLLLTTGVAYYVANDIDLIIAIVRNDFLFYGLMIGELVLVAVLSARITKFRTATAIGLFFAYAALNGVTLSVIFLAYTGESIVTTFGITAITFGIMCIYGYVTKNDLTRFSSILFMGLIGIVVLSLINMFLGSSRMEWIISIVGLFVFLGLTAYDMQKLKGYYFGTEGDAVLRGNLGVLGALNLYLDFINLFLTLLKYFGKRRD